MKFILDSVNQGLPAPPPLLIEFSPTKTLNGVRDPAQMFLNEKTTIFSVFTEARESKETLIYNFVKNKDPELLLDWGQKHLKVVQHVLRRGCCF